MKERILVVDDEKNILALFLKILTPQAVAGQDGGDGSPADLEIVTAVSADEGWGLVQQKRFDLIISDLAMEGMDGMAFLQRVKSLHPEIPFLMLTGVGTLDDAVKAMKLGAFDYLTKPFQREELLLTIRKALAFSRLHSEVKALRERLNEKEGAGFYQIIGKSKAITKIFEMIRVVAKSDSTVLIDGESGTGKELIAKAIHQESARRGQAFVAVNCGALPETLLESELFGHVRGAFTGATADKRGLFKEADHGTIFLDEIGDVSPSIQSKLLRALQEKEIRPVGSNVGIRVDVRIVAATNRPLPQMLVNKQFREDLYYRLAVITMSLPPLRDRKEDIPLLVNYFLGKYCAENGKEPRSISDQAMAALLEHDWPGNIRELENLIERLVVISSDDRIDTNHLPKELVRKLQRSHTTLTTASASTFSALNRSIHPKSEFKFSDDQTETIHDLLKQKETLKDITDTITRETERIAIVRMLHETAGNRAEAARRLGISRPSLYSKMKEYKIA